MEDPKKNKDEEGDKGGEATQTEDVEQSDEDIYGDMADESNG